MSGKKGRLTVDADVRQADSAFRSLEQESKKTNQGIRDLDATVSGLGGQLEKTAAIAHAQFALSLGQAAFQAVQQLASKVKELADEAFALEGVFQGQSLSIEQARAATRGLVKDTDLILKSNEALTFGIVKTSDEYAKIADLTTKLAHVNRVDYAEALGIVNVALANGRATGLKQLGIVIESETAERAYAETLGKTRAELTEHEKILARREEMFRQMEAGANGVTVSVDGLAGSMKSAAIEADNFWDSLLGGGIDEAKQLELAFKEHGDQLVKLAKDSRVYGASQKELEGILRDYGVVLDEETDKRQFRIELARTQLRLSKEKRDADTAEAAALEEKNALEAAGVPVLQQMIRDQVIEIENMEASGAGTRDVAYAKLELTRARILELEAQAESVGLTAEETQNLAALRRELELAEMRFDALERKGKRGGGGRRKEKKKTEEELMKELTEGAIAGMAEQRRAEQSLDEFFEYERQAELARAEEQERLAAEEMARLEARFAAQETMLQRELELQQARGEETLFLEERLRQVRESNLETLGRYDEASALHHEAEVARIAEQTRMREEAGRVYAEGAATYTTALGEMVIASGEATGSFAKNFKAELHEYSKAQAKKLALQGAGHAASAIAYAVALNPVKAAAEGTAASIAFAKAAGFGLAAIGTMDTGGGITVGAGGTGTPGGAGFAPGAQGATGSGPTTGGGRPGADAPVNPFDPGAPSPAAQQSASGGAMVVNQYISGNILREGDLEKARARAIRDGRAA